MMELSHSLLLNEEALAQIPEAKKALFIYEWLRFLDKVLVAAQKSDIKGCQKKLVEQLTAQIQAAHGPPIRQLLGCNLATLFSVGDTFLLFETINKCNDLLKNKDDSPTYLPTRLAAITCLGHMYQRLGRMVGRSYEETVQLLCKSLKSSESQTRIEIMQTLEKLCSGLGSAASTVHKEIQKACKYCLSDRVMAVRLAAAQCLLQLHMQQNPTAQPLVEFEALTALCLRALEGSSYDVRCAITNLLGTAAATVLVPPTSPHGPPTASSASAKAPAYKAPPPEEVLGVLNAAFLKGAGLGFLKGTGEMIKGAGTVSREVRVGVTQAYVVMAEKLGGAWVEQHLALWLGQVLELVASPKAAASHVDAVYSRQCVSFILRSVLGRLLGEKAQAVACKELATVISQQMRHVEIGAENAKETHSPETMYSQHVLVCALQELGGLVSALGSTASSLMADASSGVIDAALQVLLHPSQAARLAAAWCLRCICLACPQHLTPLIDKCVDALENLRSTPEAVAGYSVALAALLGGVHSCALGVPHARGKVVFNVAEELLRSAAQNARLSSPRTQAGWLVVGALLTMGTPVVKGILSRLLLLWRNVFPRSSKELESEKARGDAFTWQVTLEGRAGALASMHSFLKHCPELVTPEVIKKIMGPLEAAVAMLQGISTVVKQYGQLLKAPCAMVRLRIYETLTLLPPSAYESSCTHLLRLLVAEFTLADNPANTTTSLLKSLCHQDEASILGASPQHSDHRIIEEQLQGNSASGSGALEHDASYLYRTLPEGMMWPGPLPLGVAVIDSSVVLFGVILPHISAKHRLQILQHFGESVRTAKAGRQEAVHTNILAALLAALRALADAKVVLQSDDVRKAASALLWGVLVNPNPLLRCAGSETLGRLAQVSGDAKFVSEIMATCFEKLKSSRDVASRTGYCLALGCVHRAVGGVGTSAHLANSLSILLALGQDTASGAVQQWALNALALLAEAAGPMFRPYVEPTMTASLKLLLSASSAGAGGGAYQGDVGQGVGRCLAALITTLGPELQGTSSALAILRSSMLSACALLQEQPGPLVSAEAVSCLQQLHLFAPRHVNLATLVPSLCSMLFSPHLLLRRAAVSCLRQLVQREAREVCEHARQALTAASEAENSPGGGHKEETTSVGLPTTLFRLLDRESDAALVKDVKQTLTCLLLALGDTQLATWLTLCREVLTTATCEAGLDEGGGGAKGSEGLGTADDALGDEDDNDEETLGAKAKRGNQRNNFPAPRWPTRVFAAECVHRLVNVCDGQNPAHFDLRLARAETRSRAAQQHSDFLILHLSELIRLAFMAATSDSDPLRLQGLDLLVLIIEKFAAVPEPEFPGHVILEQYQAQVGAALRPAFSADTPPHVTAAACRVCSTWIASGVAKDLSDVKRVHALLVSSLARLGRGFREPDPQLVQATPLARTYSESAATMEQLAILQAWAEVYIASVRDLAEADSSKSKPPSQFHKKLDSEEFKTNSNSLLQLVQPELPSLTSHWLGALRDNAMLSLPPEFAQQLPPQGGAFFTLETIDSVRSYYRSAWSSILQAAALTVVARGQGDETNLSKEKSDAEKDSAASSVDPALSDDSFLLLGLCVECLCDPKSSESVADVLACLRTLQTLLQAISIRQLLLNQSALPVELVNVLHRVLLTRDSPQVQEHVLAVLSQIVAGRQARGGDTEEGEKDIAPGNSFVFAVLEVVWCLLLRHLPGLDQVPSISGNVTPSWTRPSASGDSEAHQLIATGLDVLERLPSLCSSAGALNLLPALFHVTTSVLRECSRPDKNMPPGSSTAAPCERETVRAALKCFRALVTPSVSRTADYATACHPILQSCVQRLLDWSKTVPSQTETWPVLDEGVLLLSLSVCFLQTQAEQWLGKCPTLLYPCINAFRQALQSPVPQVRVQCAQSLRLIWAQAPPSLSVPLVQGLAPRLLAHLCSPQARLPVVSSASEQQFTSEAVNCALALFPLAQDAQRVQLMSLLVPILVGFLQENLALTTVGQRALHSQALAALTKIGSQYANEFRVILGHQPALKSRLETALKAQTAETTNHSAELEKSKGHAPAPVSQAPSIRLKTDFSHFGK